MNNQLNKIHLYEKQQKKIKIRTKDQPKKIWKLYVGLVAEEMSGRVILERKWTKYSKLHTFVCKLGGQKENAQEKWNYCSNTQ